MSNPGQSASACGVSFFNAFQLAMDSIRAHKLRSFLTLLGVIIGVASVIMVGAAIDGLGVYAEQSTAKAFGSESFLVAQIAATGRLSRRQYFDKVKRNKPMRIAEQRFLESGQWRPRALQPYRNHTSDLKRENLTCEDTTVIGTSADMADIRDIGVVDGRFFTTQEERSRSFVAVIGDTVKTTLFPARLRRWAAFCVSKASNSPSSAWKKSWAPPSGAIRIRTSISPSPLSIACTGRAQVSAIFGRPRPGHSV